MTLEQARLLMSAMDLYSRLLMGQFEEFEHLFSFFGEDAIRYKRQSEDRMAVSSCLRIMKLCIYPELAENASWGITGSPCPERATIIYDMYKSLDYKISWHGNPKGGITVNYDRPMHWYKELPLPDVKVFDES